jgi:hypothetical protein
MELRNLLDDRALRALVARHLPMDEGELSERYGRFGERLAADRFVVPVTGVQGSGKSTLLNALLFSRLVLPIEADETTCVPVEIRYAPAPSMEATVRFQDGREVRVAATDDALAAYVDNEHNPENARGVDRVVLESDHPLLRNGLVLVDLPGVGSLRERNVETTRRYLEESVGVVFVLRTVPPLTASESVFVANQWARLRTAFFVQNRWTDERAAEVQSGREYNAAVLRDLAGRCRIPLAEGEPQVQVVCGLPALRAALDGDERAKEAAGLTAFAAQLAAVAETWPGRVRRDLGAALRADLEAARATVQRRCSELSSERAAVAASLAATEERYRAYVAKLEERRAAAGSELDGLVRGQTARLEGWATATRADLRDQMRQKLRSGLTDVPRLAQALQDEESVHADAIVAEVQEAILAHQDRLRESFRELGAWRFQAEVVLPTVPVGGDGGHWDGALPGVLRTAGAVGAGVGGAVAGAKWGAALGSAGGPIGAVVGGGLGALLGGLLGGWLGRKGREVVVDSRAERVQPAVFAAIDEFVSGLAGELTRSLRAFRDFAAAGLDAWIAAQRARFEAERRQTLEDLASDQGERERRLAELAGDEERLAGFLARLEGAQG